MAEEPNHPASASTSTNPLRRRTIGLASFSFSMLDHVSNAVIDQNLGARLDVSRHAKDQALLAQRLVCEPNKSSVRAALDALVSIDEASHVVHDLVDRELFAVAFYEDADDSFASADGNHGIGN